MSFQIAQSRRLNLALLALLALTVAVRLPGVRRPLLGDFVTKNVVYATIARNWARGESSAWFPTLDLLKGSQPALHLIEFPVSAYITASAWSLFGGSLDVWGRMTSIAFSTVAVVLFYLLMRRWHGPTAALAAGMALALSPIGIFCGQSFMLEASVVFFSVAAFWCLERAGPTLRTGWILLAALSLALLLLTKIYMAVILIPLCWRALQLRREATLVQPSDRSATTRWRLAVAAVAVCFAIVPAAIWHAHVFVASSPDGPLAHRLYYTLRDSVQAHQSSHSLLMTADFHRQVIDNLATVVLTPLGIVLATIGCWHPHWRRHAPWLLAAALLVVALPLKFYKMNYYYAVVLPPLCILVGLGWEQIQHRLRPGRLATATFVAFAIILSARYTVGPSFTTPAADRAVVGAADEVRRLTASNEPVVTIHGTSFELLYYCDRRGWSLPPVATDFAAHLDEYRRQGARLVVVAGLDALGRESECRALLDELPEVAGGDDYRVYRLSENALTAARDESTASSTIC